MKKVLIAHQSTIPHYRVDFYNALEANRPKSWVFEVVFDSSELQEKRFFEEEVDLTKFSFPTVDTRTFSFKFGEKVFNLQSFFIRASKYDLIIVGSALSNLTYPLCRLHQLTGKKYGIWGHGKDRTVAKPSKFKKLLEVFRTGLAKSTDGFFAYTSDIKSYLENRGVDPDKIFVLNNTIDILKQRAFFEKYLPEKNKIKKDLGLDDKKILLYVGRFTKNKRIEYLLKAFNSLIKIDPNYHLIAIGSGSGRYKADAPSQITFFEAITDLNKLAPMYVAADVFTFPGDVGLGPLQALCYDLPVITLDSPTHMPEIIYLNEKNALILPRETTPEDYAMQIHQILNNPITLNYLKAGIWESINHLTIDQMAKNFIAGVNSILKES
jgi:glycosyltransferase involved in cell wall biosynthesis